MKQHTLEMEIVFLESVWLASRMRMKDLARRSTKFGRRISKNVQKSMHPCGMSTQNQRKRNRGTEKDHRQSAL